MIKEKYSHHLLDTSISIVNSKVESVRFKDITKTSLRVYKDGCIGVAGAIGECDEDRLSKDAVEALKQRIEYPCEPSINFSKSIDMTRPILSSHHLLKETECLLEEVGTRHPNFILSNKVSLTAERFHLYNEAGLNLEYSDKAFRTVLLFKEKSSANVFDGYFDYEERYYDREKLLNQMDMLLSAYVHPVALPKPGRYPIVFYKNAFPVSKLITDLKGDVFAAGGSLLSGKAGQKLFHEAFTFHQSLDPQEAVNTPFFDAEGTVNENYRIALIEKGVLATPYTDKRTAAKHGLTHTGSAAAPYDGVPTVSFLNYSLANSGKTVKELLGGQPGIFVLVADGGDFTPDGSFATPVQLAMLFDGERFLGRLPDFMLSSGLFDMLGEGFRGMSKNAVFPYTTEKLIVTEMNIAAY